MFHGTLKTFGYAAILAERCLIVVIVLTKYHSVKLVKKAF